MIRCGIIIGGRFPAAYRTAEGLHAAGVPYRLVTSHPSSRLPHYEIDLSCMVNYGWLEYFYRACQITPWVRDIVPAQFIKNWLLDRIARRRTKDCSVINGWSGFCCGTFKAAQSRGARCVLQTGSAHTVVQHELIAHELERQRVRTRTPSNVMFTRQLEEYGLADVIVVPSTFVWRSFIKQGVPVEKLRLVPEGVEVANFAPVRKEDETFRVLYLGMLSFRKGVHYVLEAMASLRLKDAEFCIRGVPEPTFRSILARYTNGVRFLEKVPLERLAWLISQASVVVVPSIEDGWCAVTVEAMACGVPVIVSQNVGTADMVRHGEDGFIVPPADAPAIADKILWLYQNQEAGRAMGRSASQRAREYGWDRYRREIVKAIGIATASTAGGAGRDASTAGAEAKKKHGDEPSQSADYGVTSDAVRNSKLCDQAPRHVDHHCHDSSDFLK